MNTPTDQQIRAAMIWLRNNEGYEAEDCAAVADWLEYELQDRFLKREARKARIPVARLRDAMKRRVTDRLRQELAGIIAL